MFKTTAAWLLFVILSLSLYGVVSAEPYPLRDAVECRPRNGLPHFFNKVGKGRAVRIAYLGGSITAQEGWRPKTLNWFRKQFPQAEISQIHAAIVVFIAG